MVWALTRGQVLNTLRCRQGREVIDISNGFFAVTGLIQSCGRYRAQWVSFFLERYWWPLHHRHQTRLLITQSSTQALDVSICFFVFGLFVFIRHFLYQRQRDGCSLISTHPPKSPAEENTCIMCVSIHDHGCESINESINQSMNE